MPHSRSTTFPTKKYIASITARMAMYLKFFAFFSVNERSRPILTEMFQAKTSARSMGSAVMLIKISHGR